MKKKILDFHIKENQQNLFMGLIQELEDCASVRQKQDLHISFLIPKPKERCEKIQTKTF